jgi:hypothetical protein
MEMSGELHVSATLSFGGGASGTHLMDDDMNPVTGLESMEKRKVCPESNPGCPALSPSLYQLKLPYSESVLLFYIVY